MPLVEDKLGAEIGRWLKNVPTTTTRLVVKEGTCSPETPPNWAIDVDASAGLEIDTLAATLSEVCQGCADGNAKETRLWIEAVHFDKKGAAIIDRRKPFNLSPSSATSTAETERHVGMMEVVQRTNTELMQHLQIVMQHQTEHMGTVLRTQSDALLAATKNQARLEADVAKFRAELVVKDQGLEKAMALIEANQNGDDLSADDKRKEQILAFGMQYVASWMERQQRKQEADDTAAREQASHSNGNGTHDPMDDEIPSD